MVDRGGRADRQSKRLTGPDLAEQGKEEREKLLEYSFIHHRPPHHRR